MSNYKQISSWTACICCNGELRGFEFAKAMVARADMLIAADGGAEYLAALNLKPQAIKRPAHCCQGANMMIQAEVSLYPLKTDEIGVAIESFIEHLDGHDLEVKSGPMSTQISGDCAKVFAALAKCFATAADQDEIVMVANDI
jgi:uncharacterized protein YqgV (UPF0045/DUF77 family)